jgi:hypothetical protein
MPELTTSGDISAPTINPLANTSNLGICSLQSSGILNIGVGSRTKSLGTGEGNINIGTGNNTITSGTVGPTINIGTNTATTNLTEISIGAVNTKTTINGALTLTGATTAVGISASGVITTTNNITTTGTGDIQSAGKVKTATLDVIADTGTGTTALSIGSNVVNGNIVIGSALGVGDIAIAGSHIAGGTITVGSANTATLLNGTINVPNDILTNDITFAGKIGYESIAAATYSIPASGLLNIRYILRATVASTITLTGQPRGQYVIIRSTTAGIVTISMGSGISVILNASITANTTSFVLTTSSSITLYAISTSQYIQI